MAEEFLSISGKIITYSGRVVSMRNRTTSGNPVEIVLDDGSKYMTPGTVAYGNYLYYGENQYVGFHFEGDLEDIWEIYAIDTFYWLIGNQSLPNLRLVYLGSGSKSEGDIANLEDSIEALTLTGDTVVSGDIGSLPSGLTSMTISGQNTVSGDIGDAPSGLTSMTISGQNTVSGDIGDAPSGLTSMTISGQNTLLGLIDNAPAGLTYLRIQGQNTISGLIDNAPVGLTYLDIRGQNTLLGNIANAPAGLTILDIRGQNTLLGNIANAPAGLTILDIRGQNTLTYTGRQWVENQDRHLLRATQFNSQMVDQYLIDLSSVTNWTGNKTVDLRVGVAPTPASASAIATLESRGVTVITD